MEGTSDDTGGGPRPGPAKERPQKLGELSAADLARLVQELEADNRALDERYRSALDELERASHRLELLERAETLSRTGAWQLDLVTGESAISESWRRILGVDTLALSWEDFSSLIPDDDLPLLTETFEKALAGQAPYETEHRIVRASDGQVLHIHCWGEVVRDDSGHPLKIYGVSQDVTARKRVEHALAQSEERYRYALEATRDGLWDWNIPSGVVEWTPRCYEMLGFEANELVVTFEVWKGLLHPDDAEQTVETVTAQIRSGGSFTTEFRMRTRNGTYLWVLGRGQTVEWDEDGNPLRMIGTHVDITERKELEARLRHAEKMEAIGQLAGGIAHDFNNQLASIMGFADLLTMQLEDEALRHYAEGIVASAQRSAELTRQLLAYARKANYQTTPIDLHSVIQDVIEMLRHSIDRRIEINQVLEAKPATTWGDPTLVQNAVLNLAINARDAMPEGGTLRFATSTVDLDERACAGFETHPRPGRFIRIDVQDSGRGIPDEILDQIFEPFFTTKGVGEGTGMGLAAVYGTISQHGGAIDLDTAVGQGSTFKVYLPLVERAASSAPSPQNVQPAPRSARILVVDDEPQFRGAAAEMLRRLGYEVVTKEDGSSAVAYYTEHSESTDLIILDLVMPRLSGTETFRQLRAVSTRAAVLLASGFSVDGAAQQLLDEGALGFLQKPFAYAELSHKVAALVSGIDNPDT
jgi:PAS domain S-box-containing protein